MNDPLLRSANALRALFHRGVIVAEADADRALYEEINYRLLQESRGIEDGLFMNAQNWQTIPRIVAPLRRLGIPAAAVFDFDVLIDQDFGHIWPLLHAEDRELARLHQARNALLPYLRALDRDVCKGLGVNALQGAERTEAQNFLDDMSPYGIFFVPVGELECWLSHFEIPRTRNKPKWLTDVFVRLGSDPEAEDYERPTGNDVWAFIESVEAWIANPVRRGIPN